MVLYTVQSSDGKFYVTKSINFEKCCKSSDVAYGFQVDADQTQTQFQPMSEDHRRSNPFKHCDAKEVREKKLSRSTVTRLILEASKNQPGTYAIKRSVLTSQYVLKNLKAEDSPMQVVAIAEMELHQVNKMDKSAFPSKLSLQNYEEETLLFSNQWLIKEKRFHMYGDEVFDNNNSPFKGTKRKATIVEQSLRQLAQTITNSKVGIEASRF